MHTNTTPVSATATVYMHDSVMGSRAPRNRISKTNLETHWTSIRLPHIPYIRSPCTAILILPHSRM